MYNIKKAIIYFVIAFTFLALQLIAENNIEFNVEFKAGKNEYNNFEEIPLIFKCVNKTDAKGFRLSFWYGTTFDIKMYCKPDKGYQKEHGSKIEIKMKKGSKIDLFTDPVKKLSKHTEVLPEINLNQYYNFDIPGEYTLKIRYGRISDEIKKYIAMHGKDYKELENLFPSGVITKEVTFNVKCPSIAKDLSKIGFSIDLTKKKKEYDAYEPIYVRLNFNNKNDKMAFILSPINAHGITYDLFLTCKADKRFEKAFGKEFKIKAKEYFWGKYPKAPQAAKLIIDKKKQYYFQLNLLEYFKIFIPGTYTLNFRYGNLGQHIIKGDTIFPQEVQKQKVTFKLNDIKITEDYFLLRDCLGADYTTIKSEDYSPIAAELILLHQESPYYKYAYYWLGKKYQSEKPMYGNYKRAQYCFKEHIKAFPDSPIIDEVRYRLLRVEKEDIGKLLNKDWSENETLIIINKFKDEKIELIKLKEATTNLELRQKLTSDLIEIDKIIDSLKGNIIRIKKQLK
jgi:hypothetical protein